MEYPAGGRIMVDSARQVRSAAYPVWVYFAIPLLALLVQVYLPLFQTLSFISQIELPLLVTIYFALMRRSQLRGLAIGVTLGLAQDSLFQQHLGMNGICMTLSLIHIVRCSAISSCCGRFRSSRRQSRVLSCG